MITVAAPAVATIAGTKSTEVGTIQIILPTAAPGQLPGDLNRSFLFFLEFN